MIEQVVGRVGEVAALVLNFRIGVEKGDGDGTEACLLVLEAR